MRRIEGLLLTLKRHFDLPITDVQRKVEGQAASGLSLSNDGLGLKCILPASENNYLLQENMFNYASHKGNKNFLG